jgi:hypothetical protein
MTQVDQFFMSPPDQFLMSFDTEGAGRLCYSYLTIRHHPGLQLVRRKFHDDTKRGGICRQPAQAVIQS